MASTDQEIYTFWGRYKDKKAVERAPNADFIVLWSTRRYMYAVHPIPASYLELLTQEELCDVRKHIEEVLSASMSNDFIEAGQESLKRLMKIKYHNSNMARTQSEDAGSRRNRRVSFAHKTAQREFRSDDPPCNDHGAPAASRRNRITLDNDEESLRKARNSQARFEAEGLQRRNTNMYPSIHRTEPVGKSSSNAVSITYGKSKINTSSSIEDSVNKLRRQLHEIESRLDSECDNMDLRVYARPAIFFADEAIEMVPVELIDVAGPLKFAHDMTEDARQAVDEAIRDSRTTGRRQPPTGSRRYEGEPRQHIRQRRPRSLSSPRWLNRDYDPPSIWRGHLPTSMTDLPAPLVYPEYRGMSANRLHSLEEALYEDYARHTNRFPRRRPRPSW